MMQGAGTTTKTRSYRGPAGPRKYRHVSANRRCRICGKPDWCSYTLNEEVSFCARTTVGANAVSKQGWGIYFHTDGHNDTPASKPKKKTKKEEPQVELAPLEIRHAVYTELLRISPVTRYAAALVNGPGGLLSRGLPETELNKYGALPPSPKERDDLARALRLFVMQRFPDWGRKYSHAGVVGIPGFWQDRQGVVHLWKNISYTRPLLVIPYLDGEGRIQACQLRKGSEDLSDDEKRYCWMATPIERRGVGLSSPIHFTYLQNECAADETILITEGALKANVFVSLRPRARVLATSGVGNSHQELIEATRGRHVMIGFDADHRTNHQVCRQLGRLIAGRAKDAAAHNLNVSTTIVFWKGPKGIDDAALLNVPLTKLTVNEWVSTLSGQPLEEVMKILSGAP